MGRIKHKVGDVVRLPNGSIDAIKEITVSKHGGEDWARFSDGWSCELWMLSPATPVERILPTGEIAKLYGNSKGQWFDSKLNEIPNTKLKPAERKHSIGSFVLFENSVHEVVEMDPVGPGMKYPGSYRVKPLASVGYKSAICTGLELTPLIPARRARMVGGKEVIQTLYRKPNEIWIDEKGGGVKSIPLQQVKREQLQVGRRYDIMGGWRVCDTVLENAEFRAVTKSGVGQVPRDGLSFAVNNTNVYLNGTREYIFLGGVHEEPPKPHQAKLSYRDGDSWIEYPCTIISVEITPTKMGAEFKATCVGPTDGESIVPIDLKPKITIKPDDLVLASNAPKPSAEMERFKQSMQYSAATSLGLPSSMLGIPPINKYKGEIEFTRTVTQLDPTLYHIHAKRPEYAGGVLKFVPIDITKPIPPMFVVYGMPGQVFSCCGICEAHSEIMLRKLGKFPPEGERGRSVHKVDSLLICPVEWQKVMSIDVLKDLANPKNKTPVYVELSPWAQLKKCKFLGWSKFGNKSGHLEIGADGKIFLKSLDELKGNVYYPVVVRS